MTLAAIPWAEKSDEELLAALQSIWFYEEPARLEVCAEVERRRLLCDEPHSFVVEQLRRYQEPSTTQPRPACVDVSSTARLRGASSLTRRSLVVLGTLLMSLGALELLASGAPWGRVQDPGALIEGIFDAILGAIALLCALLINKYRRTAAILALTALSIPTVFWISWVLLLAFNGRLEPFRPVLLSFVGITCLTACLASLRLEALRRRRAPPSEVPIQMQFIDNWKDVRAIAALCAAFLVFAIGVAIWLRASWLQKSLRAMGELSLLDVLPTIGLWVVGVTLALIAAPLLWRFARRLAAISALQLRRVDTRLPLLLLRSFGDDEVDMTTSGERLVPALLFPPLRVFVQRVSLEEALVTSASAYGPVVALNDPASNLPPIGAAREITMDAAWRDRIQDLIRESRAIIAVIGETPGLKSELLELRRLNALGKLVLILPPVSTSSLLRRVEALFACIPELRVLPVLDLLESGAAIYLAADQQPVIVTGRRRAAAYAEAVDLALPKVCATRRAGLGNE